MARSVNRSRSSLPALVVTSMTGAGLLAVGLGALLVSLGLVELKGWTKSRTLSPDVVRVPVSGSEIPAYTRISRDHIWDKDKGQFAVVELHKSEVTDDMMVTLVQMSGRVLRRDKPKGYVFTESDFLPRGSREGLVGGIPPGKRAVVLDATKINGVFGLRVGDHVDILSSQTLDLQKALSGSQLSGPNAALLGAEKRAATHVLVQDGVLVTGVTTRTKPVTSSSLTGGTSARLIPVQEVTIAVNPAEVARLNGSITAGAQLTCVPRSGQADPSESLGPMIDLDAQPAPKQPDVSESQNQTPPGAAERGAGTALKSMPIREVDQTPSDNPLQGFTVVETVAGSNGKSTRRTLVFPAPGRGPLDLAGADASSPPVPAAKVP